MKPEDVNRIASLAKEQSGSPMLETDLKLFLSHMLMAFEVAKQLNHGHNPALKEVLEVYDRYDKFRQPPPDQSK